MDSWWEKELAGSAFKDKRLDKRFKTIVKSLSMGTGQSIPEVCEQWARTKATYRFLSNERVDEDEILNGHVVQTRERVHASEGPVLVLHDTTEFSFKRENPQAIGYTRRLPTAQRIHSAFGANHTACGLLMHASLAITPEGLPLGLLAAKFWTREKFKQANQLKRKINPTRVPIAEKESIKWLENLRHSHQVFQGAPSKLIHIGDRENDIYEYFCQCQALGCYFLVRSCVNRLTEEATLAEEIARRKPSFTHPIAYTDSTGNLIETSVEIKVKHVTLHPPVGKQSEYESIAVAMVSAVESMAPSDREPIRWNFITNLPVKTTEDTLKVIQWCQHRWQIEMYFKTLKSGLRIEESKLRTTSRLTRLIAMCCILAWRIRWITMLNRQDEQLAPKLAFDPLDRNILAQRFKTKPPPKTLQDYIICLAKLGGYLNRKNDPPPGATVIWRGLNKLSELKAGFELALNVGN